MISQNAERNFNLVLLGVEKRVSERDLNAEGNNKSGREIHLEELNETMQRKRFTYDVVDQKELLVVGSRN